MLSNAYFLAKFRFDTAENEPAKNLQNFAKNCKFFRSYLKIARFGAAATAGTTSRTSWTSRAPSSARRRRRARRRRSGRPSRTCYGGEWIVFENEQFGILDISSRIIIISEIMSGIVAQELANVL